MRNLYSTPGFPHYGWKYDGEEDLEDLVGMCDICGHSLRYAHHLSHPDWDDITVGCYCCENLLTEYVFKEVIKRDKAMKKAERNRKMKKINDWEKVKATSDFKRPPAGGYICKIIRADDNQNKEYIKLEYDIEVGEFKGYWQDTAEQFGWWGGDFYRSYKESALGMFKSFINSVEESNKGYKWDWNEKSLEGKMIGIVLGEEEYVKNDGSVGSRLKVKSTKSVQDINEGRFRIPQTKKLDEGPSAPASAPTGFTATDDDIPF